MGDFFLSADPVAYLLVALGRRSRWWAGVRGKIVAGGRKPWRAFLPPVRDTVIAGTEEHPRPAVS